MKFAEEQAQKATLIDCFPINLSDLRGTVTDMLSQFGKNGIFESYTNHNIKHIDQMLASLDWIIPSTSKQNMSPADWFMTVVSIFLHDIGLLVTKAEYENRDNSGFRRFIEDRLYSGEYGNDYRDRVLNLPESDRDRFLYEEFVREHHGRRARAWVEGVSDPSLGITIEAYDVINRVLNPLDQIIRSDLGVLIESHNLDDLKDRKKYPLIRPYGNTSESTANLVYCAVLLRTADLLQITSDRAPTRLFKIISPTNPVSQTEWVKQNSVRRVKDAVTRDGDGNLNEELPQDTIEVFATFNKQAGYFGLNAFLDYAEKQLQASHEIVETAVQKDGCKLLFPWRRIDREQIDANGFIKKQFKFELDQEKILNLLTGHTLYNDSLVVVRELAQNALDSVRLYDFRSTNDNSTKFVGKIIVKWDSHQRILEVSDNGTGMSLDVIERHLLKVGSSKYQDPSFRKTYPTFNAISRFGIGVLSAFMVADEVNILTIEEHDDEAREVSLESVHGRYLVKLLKKSEKQVQELGEHGTKFRLRIRPSASADNLLNALRSWVLIPRCEFTFVEVGKAPVSIGYESPKLAVEGLMQAAGYINSDTTREHEVVEVEDNGVRLAYALKWSETFHEYSLIETEENDNRNQDILQPAILCVHGIAVEFSSPGFKGPAIVAIADVTGPNAPKTNVARTMLEMGEQTRDVSIRVYNILVNSVRKEINRLMDKEGFTLTRATNETVYLATPLGEEYHAGARYPEELQKMISSLPVFLLEGNSENSSRISKSVQEIEQQNSFWTVEGEVVRSAESMLAQFRSDKTIKSAIDTLSNGQVVVPAPLLCNLSSLGKFQELIFDCFQISRIEIKTSPRQVNFLWQRKDASPYWFDLSAVSDLDSFNDRRAYQMVMQNFAARHQWGGETPRLLVARKELLLEGDINFGVLRAYKRIFLMPNEPIAEYFRKISFNKNDQERLSSLCFICAFIMNLKPNMARQNAENIGRSTKGFLEQMSNNLNTVLQGTDQFIQAMTSSNLNFYDPYIWSYRSNALFGNFDDDN